MMFSDSAEVARLIQAQLSERLSATGKPIPLIAEAGGQKAMSADSSALAEQVVGDVIASAFDSAGQHCSALRVLCLQESAADRTLTMLKGVLEELLIGCTDHLSIDIGPVSTAEAKETIEKHVARLHHCLGASSSDWGADSPFAGALVEDDWQTVLETNTMIVDLEGPLVPVQSATADELADDCEAYLPELATASGLGVN